MSELQCAKTIICAGGCKTSISTSEFEEATEVVLGLATAQLLSDAKALPIIEIYEEFESRSFTNSERKKFEHKATKEIKEIL